MKTIFYLSISIIIIGFNNYEVFGQLKIHNDGDVFIGGDGNNNGAKFTISAREQRNLYIHSYFSNDWEHSSDVWVNRAKTVNFAISLNGSIKYYVRGDGLACSEAGFYKWSDASLKEDISDIQSPLKKVMALNGITYKLKSNPNLNSTINSQQKVQYGLVAQDVELIVPEVVEAMHDGTRAIAYADLVPLLIEAMKEQNQIICNLETEIRGLMEKVSQEKLKMAIENDDLRNPRSSYLNQNIPNPFNQSTQISYYIADDGKTANIYIYNMNGEQLKNIPVAIAKEGSITINGSELLAGMYYYVLIVNGQEVDTKKMILTK